MLRDLIRTPQKRTIGKIKDHLASIYRIFLRQRRLELRFDNQELCFVDPPILAAPDFRDPSGPTLRWHKPIDLDFGLGLRAHGFAALRDPGSVSHAGFALFRRDRLIQGSGDEAYRPEDIFRKSNSYTYQRLFGELHLDGFEVSHTKDGFRWEEHEEIVLDELKKALDAEPLPLLRQAEGYRSRQKSEEFRRGAEEAVRRTADVLQHEAPSVLQQQLKDGAELIEPEPVLPPSALVTTRTFDLELDADTWRVQLELSNDPAVGDWVSVSDRPGSTRLDNGQPARTIGIRLAVSHPFTERFMRADLSELEPLLRVAVAIVLAEVTAREAGVQYAGEIRARINELLRDVLSKA